jgi:hypothetical protein
MASPGKGIQQRKTPNNILLQIFWENVGEFYEAFTHVILIISMSSFYYSYVIIHEILCINYIYDSEHFKVMIYA